MSFTAGEAQHAMQRFPLMQPDAFVRHRLVVVARIPMMSWLRRLVAACRARDVPGGHCRRRAAGRLAPQFRAIRRSVPTPPCDGKRCSQRPASWASDPMTCIFSNFQTGACLSEA